MYIHINAILYKLLSPILPSRQNKEKNLFLSATVNYRGSRLISFLVPGAPSLPEGAYPEDSSNSCSRCRLFNRILLCRASRVSSPRRNILKRNHVPVTACFPQRKLILAPMGKRKSCACVLVVVFCLALTKFASVLNYTKTTKAVIISAEEERDHPTLGKRLDLQLNYSTHSSYIN